MNESKLPNTEPFEDAAIREARFLLENYAPGKVGTPQGDEEIKAFIAGARFAKKHLDPTEQPNNAVKAYHSGTDSPEQPEGLLSELKRMLAQMGSEAEGRLYGYPTWLRSIIEKYDTPNHTSQANGDLYELTVYFGEDEPFDVYGPFESSAGAMAFGEKLKLDDYEVSGYGCARLIRPGSA